MTAQVPDALMVDGEELSIVAVSGTGLFDPTNHGVLLGMLHTACHRGYIARYEVRDGALTLSDLELGPVLGVSAVGATAEQTEDAIIDLRARIGTIVPFDGRLLGCADLIPELSVHMGFQPPWKYRTVLELEAHDGLVRRLENRSEQMETLRRQILEGSDDESVPEDVDPFEWIDRGQEQPDADG